MQKNNYILTIAKMMTIVLAIVFFSFNCVSQKKESTSVLHSLQLVSSIPIITPEKKIINFNDTIIVFLSGQLRIFKIPKLHSYSKTIVNKQGDILDQSIIKIEKEYSYFIY